MMRDPHMTADRQASISRMIAHDREQKRLANYEPQRQRVGETRMVSEYFRHNSNYVRRKVNEKFAKLGKDSIYFSDDVDIMSGEVFKVLKEKGKGHLHPSREDFVRMRVSIDIVEAAPWKDPFLQPDEDDEPDVVEVEEKMAGDVEEIPKDDEVKVLFKEDLGDVEFYMFDETAFFALDVVAEGMNRHEECDIVSTGRFNTNFLPFLKKHSKKINSDDKLAEIESMMNTPLRDGVEIQVVCSLKLVKFRRILDLKNDGGIRKEEIVGATNYEGLGWPREDDTIHVKLKILEGHQSEEEVDIGEVVFTFGYPNSRAKKLIPPGVLSGLSEVKKSEISRIRIQPKTDFNGVTLYESYASPKFRELNNLKPDAELVYAVEITKIMTVYSMLEDKVKYKVLTRGRQNEIKHPRVMQKASFKCRFYINEYEKTKAIGIDGEEYYERTLKEKKLIYGLGGKSPEEEPEFIPTEKYTGLAVVTTFSGELPHFVEVVMRKLNRDQHVLITTTDNDLVFNAPDMDILLRNMFLSDSTRNYNITCGELLTVLKDLDTRSGLSENEKMVIVREYFAKCIEKKNEPSVEYEFEVDFLMSYFESKDTYWDNEQAERREMMEQYKANGNMFFKAGCFSQARALYCAGAFLYSQHNYTMIHEPEETARVKPIKFALLLNFATACFKLGEFKEMSDAIEKALVLDPNNPKALMKRANFNISLGKIEKAREDLKAVKEMDAIYPGLRSEIKRLKEANEKGKKKTQKSFAGFLEKETDVIATEESRAEKPKKEKKADDSKGLIDFSGVDPKDWAKKAAEFYNLKDFDVDKIRGDKEEEK